MLGEFVKVKSTTALLIQEFQDKSTNLANFTHNRHVYFTSMGQFAQPEIVCGRLQQLANWQEDWITTFNVDSLSPIWLSNLSGQG